MGTRADFYVGRGKTAEWIGSIAFDGYPDGIPDTLRCATSERLYRQEVERFFGDRDGDLTRPEDGWPWPWEDSQTTDYAYAFDGGDVWGSCFGGPWFNAAEEEPEDDEDATARRKEAVFPNMKDRQNVTMGRRSGLIVVTIPK